MLWWDRVAPLGNPVVPDVYWMLIGWSKSSSASPEREALVRASVQELVPLGAEQNALP